MRRIDDQAVSRAYWEWLRTENPWLPPYERLTTALFSLDVSTRDLEMKVTLDWPSEPFQFDQWEQALSDEPWDHRDEWDGLLQSAISLTADAIYQLDGDKETYFECLVFAALRIRAMAPAGTEWLPHYAVGQDERRRLLRSVLRSLTSADETRGTKYESHGLADAESALHSLWMSEKEQQ